jgi:16S rRNA (adenine1518-N6/adenine1519-N6)-dimethyltransferase
MKAKRSLGQNFFINVNLGKHIVERVMEVKPKTIVEIGPGKGFFTQLFDKKNVNIICIEKDDILSQKLKDFLPKVEVHNTDVLEVDFDNLLKSKESPVCFGSLPYNLSKKIIDLLIKTKAVRHYFFVIQKEVAEKYVRKERSSILSLRTKLFADAKILFNISPSNFTPKPKVDSSLIYFKKNERYRDIEDIDRFISYLHKAFKQPRKKLKNNLSNVYDIRKISNRNLLGKRAEELDLDQHLEIWGGLDL